MKHIISENSAVASSKKRPIDISKLKFVKESEDNYLEEFETNGYNVIKWLVAKVNISIYFLITHEMLI